VPCAHFSNLPSTPQADNARKSGMVKPLRPGTDPAISWMSLSMPVGVAPAGNAGTLESHAVKRLTAPLPSRVAKRSLVSRNCRF
jgi:hypothetical protein